MYLLCSLISELRAAATAALIHPLLAVIGPRPTLHKTTEGNFSGFSVSFQVTTWAERPREVTYLYCTAQDSALKA